MSQRQESTYLGTLKRLASFKHAEHVDAVAIGPEMISFFKQSVKKRQAKLSQVGEYWDRLVPEMLAERCALHTLHRGTLTVVVDSAAHLYELKQLLLAGIEQQLIFACRGAGLKKVTLKIGHWYDNTGNPQFA